MREFICGRNSVQDAIDNNLPLRVIYTTRKNDIQNATKEKIEVVSKDFLDKLTKENHQGFVAELKEFNYYDIQEVFRDKPRKVLILDHVQDPRNLGAIMRSANAAGVKHIIIPRDRAAKVTASALKVSSGGYVGLKIIRVSSIIDAITKLKNNDFWVYASALDEHATDINATTFNYPIAMVVGNEEKGVSNTVLKHSDGNVFIKMEGTVQSLNVSVAAGIILFKI